MSKMIKSLLEMNNDSAILRLHERYGMPTSKAREFMRELRDEENIPVSVNKFKRGEYVKIKNNGRMDYYIVDYTDQRGMVYTADHTQIGLETQLISVR